MQLCCGVFLGAHHTLNPEESNNNTTGQEAITPTTAQPNELCYGAISNYFFTYSKDWYSNDSQSVSLPHSKI